MKHLFIVNPSAGGSDKTADVRDRVQRAFAGREDAYEIYVTTGPMDATRKIRLEADTGEELRVYACGGDGTFNECVNGAAKRDNVSLAPFPIGTGNDFCRMFGEESELFRDLDALLDGAVQSIDLIDCNGRYSANICSVGIDARVGTDVHKYSKLPLVGGAGGYVVSAAVNMFKGIASEMSVRCGDYERTGKTSLVCACNGRFYGGGFNPSPRARPDDGLMDVFVVKKVSVLEFALLIGKYAKGEADKMPKYVKHLNTAGPLELDFARTEVVNVDGEAMFTDKVVMRLIPGALKLIVPKGMRFFEDNSR